MNIEITKKEAELIAQLLKEKSVPIGAENGEETLALGNGLLRKCESVVKEVEKGEKPD